MITIKKISLIEVKELVELSYEGDRDVWGKFHIAKFDFKTAVTVTMMMIDLDSKKMKFHHYKVMWNKKPIGYFTTGEKYLYSFAINIKFRKPEILSAWWKLVKKELGKHFECRLYVNNIRAIKFLEKCGMRIVGANHADNSVTLLNYN